MSILSRLFGSKSAPEVKPEMYKEFAIYPDIGSGGKYRIQARIEKEIEGETKSHLMIRADTFQEREVTERLTLAKAKQMIDEQGVGLFDGR